MRRREEKFILQRVSDSDGFQSDEDARFLSGLLNKFYFCCLSSRLVGDSLENIEEN